MDGLSPLPTTTELIPPRAQADSGPVDDPSPQPIVTDSTEAPPAPTSVDADGLEAMSADERSLIDSWRSAVSASNGVWPGFDLASIPTLLAAIDNEGAVKAAVMFNHPNPGAFGAPTQSLDVNGHMIVTIGEVADPDWLASRAPLDLFANVGGVDTFLVVSREGELGLEPDTPSFVALLVHEAFHRHGFEEWAPSATVQYFDSYDYSAANLELALLENRILIAAYQAENPGDLERLARQFAAVRSVRRQRDHRVVHDEEQERSEGSARFLEHRIGDSIGLVYTSANHTRDLHYHDQNLSTPEVLAGDVKWFFSLSRFYSTGSTLLWLLDRFGVSEVARQLQDGKTPAVLLKEHLAPLGDLDELLAGARADHDPDNGLGAIAATLADLVLDEPAIGDGQETVTEISDDELACLEANGIEVGHELTRIPPEVARECFGDAGDPDDSPR